MTHIVIFCKSSAIPRIGDSIFLGICDHVSARTRYRRTAFEILDKDIYIELRPDSIIKAGGLKPTYVLLDDSCAYEFCECWRYNMKDRYTELDSLEDVIKLVIAKGDKE